LETRVKPSKKRALKGTTSMFIGHFALGFAAKRAAPQVSLGLLFAAAQFADLLWPGLVALGVEQVRIDPGNTAFTPLDFESYPWSHSLILLVVWGIAIGSLARASGRTVRAAVVIGALVVSHWILDFVMHRPDLPLYPGSAKYGLGLWQSVPATFAIEAALYAAGLWIYVRSTRARDRVGRWGFWALAGFLVVAYLGAAGSPPPSVTAVWVAGIVGGVLILVWSAWIDGHRTPT
jgi:hypothetical protein